MPDPTILLKIARMLGQSIGKRGAGLTGPLSKGLAEDPEILSLLQAAEKYASGFSPNVLSQASAERADLLQSAMTHFRRGMKPQEVAGAAKTGIDEFLKTAQEKIAKYRTKLPILPEIVDPKTLPVPGEGATGLAEKAQEVYNLASPRLKAYLDHIMDPSKPYPATSRGPIETELKQLRERVGEPRLVAPEKGRKGPRGPVTPEIEPEAPSAAFREQEGPEEVFESFKKLFKEVSPKKTPKPKRSLKDEVRSE